MNLKHLPYAALLFALPLAAQAAGKLENELDLFYVDAGLEVSYPGGSDEIDGDGFGIKGQYAFSDHVFFTGEYQDASYDDVDVDNRQLRLGVGISSAQDDALLVLFGRLEYIHAEIASDSNDGYGVHAGLLVNPIERLQLKGSIGYVDIGSGRGLVGDGEGMEFLVGAAFGFSPRFAAFADYRMTELKAGHGVSFDLDDLRVGLRLNF